jgi:hypothetical protein
MPLRLWVAVHSGALGDGELREFISREVRLLFTHQQKPAIVAVHNAVHPREDSLSNRQFVRSIPQQLDRSVRNAQRSYLSN